MFLEITSEDKARLKNLNSDKMAVFALKKLFLNVCAEKPFSTHTNTLAAERIALECIKRAFEDLNNMRTDEAKMDAGDNPAF